MLVLRGAESDFLTADGVRRMADTHPAVRAIEIEGCGHAPTLLRAGHVSPVVEHRCA